MFEAVITAEIERLVLRRLPAQLSESQSGLEWFAEASCEAAELGDVFRKCDRYRTGGLFVIAFISGEKLEVILDDRPAEANSGLNASIGGIAGQGRKLEVLLRRRHPGLRLVKAERLPL